MSARQVLPNERVTFALLHQDDHLLVVSKPPHVPTQPGKAHTRDTLLNGLFARFGNRLESLGPSRDFGLLHRLDRRASGLLIVALSPRAWDALRQDFEHRRIAKFYWAVTAKPPTQPKGLIDLPIASVTRDQKRAAISPAGAPAQTAYRLLATGSTTPPAALLECRPITGRLHQIRVHLRAIHCPILGDDFYAPPRARALAPRLALHAYRLVFDHPLTGRRIDVATPWPRDLRALLNRLGLPRPDAPPSD